MSQTQSLLLAALGGLTVFLSGALPAREAEVVPTVPNAEAEQTMDQAIALLNPERLRWMQMDFWQQGNFAEMSYQADGHYAAGPGHRLRLDLQVRVGQVANRLQIVCNGETLWQVEQRGPAQPAVTRVSLPPVLEAVNRSGITEKRRDDFYQDQLMAGPGALLRSLRPSTSFTRLERTRWKDRDVLVLTGVRASPDPAKKWPEMLPRRCRLFLEAGTLWPCRVEWWGPTVEGDAQDSLLLQVEFRDPVLGQVVPDQAFTYQPGKSKVTDVTTAWLGGVRYGFPDIEVK